MNSWKVLLATLVIFGAGVVTGGLVVNYALRGNPPPAQESAQKSQPPATPWHAQSREFLRRMDRELALTREQHQRIEKLISESQERTRALWKPIAPQMARETQAVRESIRNELTPDQLRRFEEISRPRLFPRRDDAGREDRRTRNQRRNGLTNSAPSEFAPTNCPATQPVAIQK